MREIKAFHGRGPSLSPHRSSSSSDDWRTHYHLTAAEAQASIHLIHSVWSIKHLINEKSILKIDKSKFHGVSYKP